MRRTVALLLGFALSLSGAGCRNCDLVEAELRTKENEIRELRDELHKAESCNLALERQLHGHPGIAAKLSPELANQIYSVKEIVLGRQTGGYDDDGCAGDEALQVVLEPIDPDGHSIKAPGALHVEATQITSEGLKLPLSSWDVPPDQLRRKWRNGLLASAYYVVLPWQVPPSTTKLRVTARFTLPDDRVFEADKDVTIRLPVVPPTKVMPPLPEVDGLSPAPVPDADTPLPVPRKLKPKSGVFQETRKPARPEPAKGIEPASWAGSAGVAPVQILRPVPLR